MLNQDQEADDLEEKKYVVFYWRCDEGKGT